MLESPVPGVADALAVRDFLRVVLREDPPPPLVVAVSQSGLDAGGAVSGNNRCRGRHYLAHARLR